MARRETEEQTRNWMMQNLFGEESEDEDEVEEEVVDSEHKPAVNQPDFQSDEAEGEVEIDGPEIDGEGEVEVDSEAEAHNMDIDQAVSDRGRVQISQERRISDQRVVSELEGYADSEEEAYGQREVVANNSPGLDDTHYADNDSENEVDQARKTRRSLEGHQDLEVVRDVFGDSDEDEPAGHGAQNELKPDSYRDSMEDAGNYEKDLGPEDIVPDIDAHYGSEDEDFEQKSKEKLVGPPLDLEVALCRPPGQPSTMNLIKVSNIMGIERKAFDPETYVEEDVFATDESGTKKRIRLENNIVRYRCVKNCDGTFSYESNARFVQWSDGSIQLLIGDEVLDTSVQDARHDQAHLFLRHGKGILQSQGRLLQKMRFMPSSLSSKSHRLLTAIVDSHHKKVYKVKNCITNIDPEKEKEEQEKVEGQSIRANELLQRKREKVNNKYVKSALIRQRQLSPGFLEDVLDEEEGAHEAQREKCIINAKRKNVSRKPSFDRGPRRSVGEDGGSEREESEYEMDGEDVERDTRDEEEGPVEEYFQEEVDAEPVEAEEEDPEEIGVQSFRQNSVESDEDSPPRKTINRRKSVVFDSDED